MVRHRTSLLCVATLLGMAALLQLSAQAQEPAPSVGLVRDWSFHHAVFARIGPPKEMYAAARDPRAVQAWRSALLAAAPPTSYGPEDEARSFHGRFPLRPRPVLRPHVYTDWSISLGSAGTATAMYPAKFSFDINAAPDCTNDFVVYPVNQSPNSTHENLVAFNNLYSGTAGTTGICNRAASAGDVGTSATVMWSYAVQSSDNAGVMTSPVLSLDGKKVAFVTSMNGQQPHFHVLAWKSGDGVNSSDLQDPAGTTKVLNLFTTSAPTAGSGTATDLAFGASSGGPGDTLSSPFVDYGRDTAYVGDDKGNLVRIKNVFCPGNSCAGAAPSIDTSWGIGGTVAVACAAKLTGPVVDVTTTGNVFVGCSDGKLYGFNSSGTALANSPVTVGDGSATGGVVDPPVVDGVNGFVYAFSGNNGANAVAAQTKIDLSSLVTVPLGAGGAGIVHSGALNDAYFSSATSTNWFLYAQGFNGGGTQTFLYWIGFGATRSMHATATAHTNTHPAATQASPLTEFLNAGTDRLFFGVAAWNGFEVLFLKTNTNPRSTPKKKRAVAGVKK